MGKQVLIVSNGEDLHADLVVPLVLASDVEVFRLNLDEFPRDYHITQCVSNSNTECSITHMPSGQTINVAKVTSIWIRKPAEYVFLSEDLLPQEFAYAKLEAEHALFGLLYSLDCFWMSHPLALRSANWKGEQLRRASRMGFRIPASIISNSPQAVLAFKESFAGDMIFKSLSTPDLAASDVSAEERIAGGLGTTIVTDEMFGCIDAVSELPCHFQEYIAKQYELRVTIIGEKIFAAKIYSQDDARTTIDSRDMSAEIRFEATTLPQEIAELCLSFVKSYGLNYSALDLIVTPENEYVFLENNPTGQFLYVEELIPEFKLMQTLAETLIEGK